MPQAPLNELKDWALILNLAGNYLCGEPFLKKTGFIIEKNIGVLKEYVEELKRKSVGKLVDEISLNESLGPISEIAEALQQADEKTRENCFSGRTGSDLAEKIKALQSEIVRLKTRLEGEGVSYTGVDSVKGILGRLRFVVTAVVATTKFGLKIFGVLFLLCLLVFSYFFVTMESEQSLLKKIEGNRADIHSAEAQLSRTKSEIDEIRERITDIGEYESNRSDKIEVMDLNLKIYNLTEEQQKIRAQMDVEKKALNKNLEKLEKMKHKTFLQRLLKK